MSTFTKTECLVFSDNRKIAVIEEKKRKYIGNNGATKLLECWHIDDCIIKEGQRCDFLLLNLDTLTAYFIELKGSDLIHAIEQIDVTLDKLLTSIPQYTSINGRIVLSKVNTPDLKNSKLIKLQKRLKKLGGTLDKSVSQMTENI
jgi:hypothetical protein